MKIKLIKDFKGMLVDSYKILDKGLETELNSEQTDSLILLGYAEEIKPVKVEVKTEVKKTTKKKGK